MSASSKTLRKFTDSQADLAKSFRDGVETTLRELLTSGDNAYWTTLDCRRDGNGNLSWYVHLHNEDQASAASRD